MEVAVIAVFSVIDLALLWGLARFISISVTRVLLQTQVEIQVAAGEIQVAPEESKVGQEEIKVKENGWLRGVRLWLLIAVAVVLVWWIWWALWGNNPANVGTSDRWLDVVLGLGAVATMLTFGAALWIGIKAASIAKTQNSIVAAQNAIVEGQKKIAGIAELRAIDELMITPSVLDARKTVAEAYLNRTAVDRSAAGELLDLMDQVSIYLGEGLISLDTLSSYYSGRFISWWYAVRDFAKAYRIELKDDPLWEGGESLVYAMQVEARERSWEWSTNPPNDEVLRRAFRESINQIDRFLKIHAQDRSSA